MKIKTTIAGLKQRTVAPVYAKSSTSSASKNIEALIFGLNSNQLT